MLEHANESGPHELDELGLAKESKSHNNELEHAKESRTHELNELDLAKENKSHNNESEHAKESRTHELNELEPNELEHVNESGPHELNDNNGSMLNSDIERQREELKTMLGNYGRSRNGLILMLCEFSQDRKDAAFQRDIDEAQKISIHDLLTLELDEQKNHDLELSQLHEDVL
jgi:hypothetical protein